MLASRLQNASSLLFQTQFGFATKNLKQIKIRMKAVESIKKITKVNLCTHRPWRWWQPPRWSKTSEDSKKQRTTELDLFNVSSKIRPISLKRSPTSLPKNGCLCPSQPTRDCAVESTPILSEKSKQWLKLTAALTNYLLLETRDQLPSAEPWLTSSTPQSPTLTPLWTSPQV